MAKAYITSYLCAECGDIMEFSFAKVVVCRNKKCSQYGVWCDPMPVDLRELSQDEKEQRAIIKMNYGDREG